MSEGTSFIHNSTTAVQHALHARLSGSSAPSTISGPTSVGSGAILSSSDPFSVARSSVLQFVTDSLRHKSDRVAAVEDYVHNATGDLVLMGLWQSVCLQNYEIALLPSAEEEDGGDEGTRRTLEPIQELGQGLPPYFFARDDRVTSHFIERVQRLERALEVIQAKSVTAGASAGGGAKRTKRNPRMWKVAREVKERLQESVRRLNSGERLEVVRSTVMR